MSHVHGPAPLHRLLLVHPQQLQQQYDRLDCSPLSLLRPSTETLCVQLGEFRARGYAVGLDAYTYCAVPCTHARAHSCLLLAGTAELLTFCSARYTGSALPPG
eukprot:scpid23891/ scgid32597/ 